MCGTGSPCARHRPRSATLLYGRALARRQLGRAREAELDMTEARRLVPDIDRIFAGRGSV
jgi:hypothetical protein